MEGERWKGVVNVNVKVNVDKSSGWLVAGYA